MTADVDGRDRAVRRLDSRFGRVLIGVAVVGIVMAVMSDLRDTTPGYKDATREIGGALVSGAVVGGLVVWYEDRREGQRFEREEIRAARASIEAFQRDIDLRLFAVVGVEFGRSRAAWLEDLEATTRSSTVGETTRPSHDGAAFDLPQIAGRINALLSLLSEETLQSSWSVWTELVQAAGSLPGPTLGHSPDPDVRPATLDRVALNNWMVREDAAFTEFASAVRAHRLRHYPRLTDRR